MSDELRKQIVLWLNKEMWNVDVEVSSHNLNAYGKALLICIARNGVIPQEQRNWVTGYLASMGAPEELSHELSTYETTGKDLKEVISSSPAANQTRTALIYDAMKAWSVDDGNYKDYKPLIDKLANQLGISISTIKQIEGIYQEEKALKQKKLEVLLPKTVPDYSK
ncbi:hypothetical protein [Nostoc sp. FACHB-888]|uniref:hypothetical protein n=1 Tax=Nostoc sp. FACHB-888 TaxID=2692842 RepID=UPI001687EE7A|nr:hypothetical protein [Nostoc sp. FACHB-888]MBD2247683.1 hypothetical protein [Nostoc sp. FACHB-888]